MDAIIFRIYGEPKGKQRPKFSRQGNAVRTYTPSQTVEYEKRVVEAFRRSGGDGFWCSKDEYFSMCVIAYFAMPKSTTKKQKAKMLSNPPEIYPKKPDCDNIGKIVADALNEIAYYDDSRMHTQTVIKRYTEGEPYVAVYLGKVNQNNEKNNSTADSI